MKLKGAKAVHYDSGPNMTPLVDVVMVILIFLMLAGQFSANEHYLVSSLPISKKGMAGAVPPGAIPPPEVNIRVDAAGSRYVATLGNRHISDGATLQAALVQMHKTFPNPDNVQIIITPGRQVMYKNLMEVYEAATAASFSKIGFGVSGH